jgi:acyl-coenzyme A thioesterase PaaI-like protein
VSPTPGPPSGSPRSLGPPTSTGDTPMNRLAEAVRRISAVVVGHPVPEEEVTKAADQLVALAESLEQSATLSRRARTQPDLTGHPQDFFPTSPMIGFANPIAPPVEVWLGESETGEREIQGRVTFGYQYEGPPTCVHGGVIAELFDELMGAANVIADKPAMTGTLKVRYRKPTPLLTPLDLRARFVRSEGRKVHTWAGIYNDGALTAEADGLFIEVRPGRMLDIVTTNANANREPVIDAEYARLIADNTRPSSNSGVGTETP